MTGRIDTDICVIGAGSGGLTVAAGAVQMGADTVLIERDRMGGDCLNTGCVPSKALIAAAAAAQAVRGAGRFGVNGHEPEIDPAAVHDHVERVIAGIRPNDSEERFRGLGVQVIRDSARFVGPDRVRAGAVEIRARRFVIATGSRPVLPPIPGLAETPHLTNETVFDLRTRPAHLVVIGGGPIGAELAQAHRRLGSRVTVLERGRMLSREDPELVAVVRNALAAEGVALREGVEIARVERDGNGIAVVLGGDGGERRIAGSDLLVAAGRRPVIEDLGLDAAGIAHDQRGITVDARLRTSNRRVYAIGDVAGGPQFTHLAGHHAGIVLRNALFRLPARAKTLSVPRVTFTDPELAQVGLTEDEARQRHGEVRVLRAGFDESDRARTGLATEGLVKLVATRRGRVLGAGIAGPHAGEMIHLWTLAIDQGIGLGAIAGMVAPYPTLGELSKRAAGSYFAPVLFGPRTRRIVRLLRLLG